MKSEKLICAAGLCLVALSCLFPPTARLVNGRSWGSYGHEFLPMIEEGHRVDIGNLVASWLAIGAVAGVIILVRSKGGGK